MNSLQVEIEDATDLEERLLRSLAHFCAKKLFPRISNVYVSIDVFDMPGSSFGFCTPAPEDRNDRPRCFTIEINKSISIEHKLITLAHEFVHVKQYARGELFTNTQTRKTKWKGTYFDQLPDYFEAPWELEAYEKEELLFNQWAATLNKSEERL